VTLLCLQPSLSINSIVGFETQIMSLTNHVVSRQVIVCFLAFHVISCVIGLLRLALNKVEGEGRAEARVARSKMSS
jgi:hypothetical protein